VERNAGCGSIGVPTGVAGLVSPYSRRNSMPCNVCVRDIPSFTDRIDPGGDDVAKLMGGEPAGMRLFGL
jgi:hypothetical protein